MPIQVTSIYPANMITSHVFQLSRKLASLVAVDINLRGCIALEYTDNINIMSCYRGLKHASLHSRTCTY